MAHDRVEAVERALTILNCFTEDKDKQHLSLKELADHTGFYKSTILRLVASLERYGYLVKQQDGCYQLGLTIIGLGDLARRNFDLSSLVRPVIEEICARFNESVAFYVKNGDKRLCLYRANANRAIRHQLEEGRRLPLEKGAAGRVILAYDDEPGEPYETIRSKQWYVSLGERDPEVASVAVPLLNKEGLFLGVLSVSGLISRFDTARQHEIIEVLQNQATELADQINPKIVMDMTS